MRWISIACFITFSSCSANRSTHIYKYDVVYAPEEQCFDSIAVWRAYSNANDCGAWQEWKVKEGKGHMLVVCRCIRPISDHMGQRP